MKAKIEKAIMNKLDKVAEELRVEFNNEDDRKYWSLIRERDALRKSLQKLYNNRLSNETCPVVAGGYGYTRFETLKQDVQDKIQREWFTGFRQGAWVYWIKGGPVANNLKDAVAWIENNSLQGVAV